MLALVSLAGFAFLYWETLSFPASPIRGQPGPALFPRAILLMLLAVSALILAVAVAEALRGRPTATAADSDDEGMLDFDWRTYVWTILVVLAFVGLLWLVGFEATSLLIMSVLLYRALGDATRAVVGAVVSTLVYYVVFVLGLGVEMPLAVLPQFINL